MLFALATFALILALVVTPYWLVVVRSEERESRKLRKRMKVSLVKSAPPDLLQTEKPLSTVPLVDRALRQASFVVLPIRRKVHQAGLDLTAGTVILGSVFMFLVALGSVTWVTKSWIAGAVAGLVMGALPFIALRLKAAARLRKFEEQFPDATELLARALRAGHAFTTGLSMVAEELPDPVGTEFRLVYDRQAFGMPLTDALRDMAQRVPLVDSRFFVTAVLTQRESGGNLSEVLDNLGRLMRERFTVRREVRTLSAHGRITGWVLAGLTPTLATILFVIAPRHMSLLISDPIGRVMVGIALTLQILAYFVIRRIINIEI